MSPFIIRNRYPALVLALFISSVGILFPRFWRTIDVNRWSVAFLANVMGPERRAEPGPRAPLAHGRAVLWLAQDALNSGEVGVALDLIQPVFKDADPMMLSLQGYVLAASGDFKGAVDAWIEAGDYQSLIQAAGESTSAGLLEDAELAYRGAMGVNPISGTLPLANFQWHIKNDPSEAEQILRQSLEAYGPVELNWIRALGNVLRAQSRWYEALSLYQLALEHKPEDLYTLRIIGEALYLGNNDPDGAMKVFQEMLSIAPDKGDAYFAIGQLFANQGHYNEADQWLVQAIARNPDDPWWWVVRANAARNAQKLPLALDIYTQTVQQFPNYSIAYYEMAWAYKLNNQPEQAKRSIELALDRRQIPDAWYYVRAGEIYEWVDDKASALGAYRRALEITPQNQVAIQAAQNALTRLNVNDE